MARHRPIFNRRRPLTEDAFSSANQLSAQATNPI
jgi:hypothetical protein